MLIFNFFRRDRRLKRERDEIYSQIKQIDAYKLKVEDELKYLADAQKDLRYRLNEINIKLKLINDETVSDKN